MESFGASSNFSAESWVMGLDAALFGALEIKLTLTLEKRSITLGYILVDAASAPAEALVRADPLLVLCYIILQKLDRHQK